MAWAAAGAQIHEYEKDAEAGRDGGRRRAERAAIDLQRVRAAIDLQRVRAAIDDDDELRALVHENSAVSYAFRCDGRTRASLKNYLNL